METGAKLIKKFLYFVAIGLFPLICYAGGPKYTYPSPPSPPGLDDEMQNVYHNISYPTINYGTASSMTVTSLSISTVTSVSSATFTNLSATNATVGTLNVTSAYQYLANSLVKIVQIASFSTGSPSSNTTGTFASTNLSMPFTPKLNNSKVLIIATGALRSATAGNDAFATLATGAGNLGPANGFCDTQNDSTTGGQAGCTIIAFDSPAGASRTYNVQIRSNDGTHNTTFGVSSTSQTIVAIEYLP